SLVIIAVAVAAKIVLGRFVKSQGEKVNSGSLVASGADALNDAILSSSVLACALLFKLTSGKVALEAYVGIVIAVFIIKAGIEMMTETLDEILGQRADRETTVNVKKILNEEPGVQGAYDLYLYNYGPDKNYASVHLELPDTMTVKEVDQLTRRAEVRVYKETGVLLTGVGVYSYNTGNDEAAKIRNDIQRTVLLHDWAVQMHGFYADTEKKVITFDVVLSFDVDPKEAIATLCEEVGRKYPGYDLQIVPDVDVSVTE
ncbi:MAG: cation diffusion facilitator family transporter, partial [Blautia sp.]|nr:cation diffusion facilitator family transporter [Blautia sp.]